MLIECKIKNIDYAEIADKLLQLESAKKDGKLFFTAVKSFVGIGMKIMPQSIKDAAVIRLCTQYSENIIRLLNKLISDNGIDATINSFRLEGDSKLMNIQIAVDNISYEQIIIKFLPQIIGLIPKNENTKVFTDALDILGDDVDSTVKVLLQNIDEAKKEELVKLFVNNYSKNISGLLNKLMTEKEITAEITEIKVL